MNVSPKLDAFIGLDIAASRAGITRRTLQNKLSAGLIPAAAVRLEGRQKLVSLAALEKLFGPLPEEGEKAVNLPGSFTEDFLEIKSQLKAQETIIANLEATLNYERKDREDERQQWRKAIEQSQANLLAAQDTPTARALAGAPPSAPVPKKKPKPKKSWWRGLFLC